ncbi:MAG TPA: hypothetical protein VIG33_05665, partial [Pseudobdellovibrionaceae bacterium]
AKVKTYESEPSFVYAGGAQKWQCTEVMMESINSSHMNGTILSPDKDYFSKILKRGKIKLKSTNSEGVVQELKGAHFSFVLRESNLINQVACPTKLIEAMTYGCLPVLENTDLGDFKDLGYQYISLANFKDNKLPSSIEFEKAILKNKLIIDSLFEHYKITTDHIFSSFKETTTATNSQLEEIHKFLLLERARVLQKLVLSKRILAPREIYRFLRFLVKKYLG